MAKLVKGVIGIGLVVLIGAGIYLGFVKKSNVEVEENVINELYSMVEANGYL